MVAIVEDPLVEQVVDGEGTDVSMRWPTISLIDHAPGAGWKRLTAAGNAATSTSSIGTVACNRDVTWAIVTIQFT